MAIVTRQAIVDGQVTLVTEVLNLDEAIRAAHRYADNVVKALAGALFREAEAIMTEAKAECPVDVGTLHDSGFVELPKVEGSEVSVTLGFGGAAADYALKQHEDLTLQHDDGKAKFLEDPYRRHLVGIDRRIADDIRSHAVGA